MSHLRFATMPLALLLLGLTGCMVGPDYHRPDIPAPKRWEGAGADSLTTQPLAATQWWTLLKDPKLNALIAQAAASNLDVKLATERIREARAQFQVTRADLFPTVNADAAYNYSRRSGATSSGGSTRLGGSGSSGTGASGGTGSSGGSASGASSGSIKPKLTSEVYQAGFDAAWELDIFGGTRRAVESARANVEASQENLRAVQVSLFGEVARNYVLLRGLQYQADITSRTIAAQQKTYDLTRVRFEAGVTSQLDLARARAQLETTRSQAPAIEAGIKQTIYRLSVLLGRDPGALTRELSVAGPIPVPPGVVTVGVPSELLRRRPDIRAAERQLAAATARIGVAVADLYPRFTLTGSFGTQGLQASDLFQGSSRFWSVGPAMRWPILDFGRIRGNIKIQTSLQQQALIQYQQTILGALEEAEDDFVAYVQEQIRRQSLQDAVAANQKAFDLATLQYTAGIIDFLNVLDAQRSLYASQILLAQSETNISVDLVALYKSLGGGWEVPPAQVASR